MPLIQADNSKNRLGSEIDVRDVRLGTFFDPLLSTIFGGNAFSWQRNCTVGVDHDMISWFKPLEVYSDI